MTGYRIQIPPTTDLHRKEITLRVKQLGEMYKALGMREVWFETRSEVLNYLNDVCGVRTPQGARIGPQTLRRWAWKAGFPLFRNGWCTRIATSNLLIMAWLWSYRAYQSIHARAPQQRHLDAIAHLA